MKIALIQTELHWLDPKANLIHFEQLIRQVSEDVNLIILPEMFTTGFAMDIPSEILPTEEFMLTWMRQQATIKKASLCGSVCVEEQGKRFNRLLYINAEGQIHRYNKRHLFRMAGEHEVFEAGSERVVFNDYGIGIMPLICYDLRFPVWSRNVEQAELQIFVANWPEARHLQWTRLLQARAIENQCYVAGVNRCGLDGNGIRYNGQSAVYNWLGEPCNRLSEPEEIIEVSLDLSHLDTFRTQFPAWKDADSFTLKR